MIMRIVSLLLAFVLPPVAIWLMRGLSVGFWISAALCVSALAVFWILFAGPGVALWGLAVAQAVGVAAFMRRLGPGKTRDGSGEMT